MTNAALNVVDQCELPRLATFSAVLVKCARGPFYSRIFLFIIPDVTGSAHRVLLAAAFSTRSAAARVADEPLPRGADGDAPANARRLRGRGRAAAAADGDWLRVSGLREGSE